MTTYEMLRIAGLIIWIGGGILEVVGMMCMNGKTRIGRALQMQTIGFLLIIAGIAMMAAANDIEGPPQPLGHLPAKQSFLTTPRNGHYNNSLEKIVSTSF